MAEGRQAEARAEPLRVRIGEFRIAGPGHRLAIHGLGSCVAVLLHDPAARLSGLGHFLLPAPPSERSGLPPGRFVSTGIPAMVRALRERGARRTRLLAKLAGAAQMFRYEGRCDGEAVGARNLEATLRILERLAVPIAGRDTGGSYGRTILADAGTGRMEVRAVRIDQRIL